MDRREFVKRAAGALVFVPALLHLEACGDDTSAAGSDGGKGNAGSQGVSGTSAGTQSGGGSGGGGNGSAGPDGSVSLDGAVGDDGGLLSRADASAPNAGVDGSVAVDSGTDAGPACTTGAHDTLISGNHGHVLTVPMADVTAAADATYAIMGGAPHNHDVTLTAADFAQLALGNSVMVTSTDGGGGPHHHTVTVHCV